MTRLTVFLLGLAALMVTSGCGDDGGGKFNPPPVDAGNNDVGDNNNDGGGNNDGGDNNPPGECPQGQEVRGNACVFIETGSPFTCEIMPVAPCGGDIVGTWAYTDSCERFEFNPYAEECVGIEFYLWREYEDGEIVFTDNGRYTERYLPIENIYSVVPEACYEGETNRCRTLSVSLGLGDCVEMEAECECMASTAFEERENFSGDYVVSGTNVIFDDFEMSPFCVVDDTMLLLRDFSGNGLYEPLFLTRVGGGGEGN